MSTPAQVPTLADLQRAEAEISAAEQRLEQELARHQQSAAQLVQRIEQLSVRAQSLAAGGADVGVVAAQLATTRVPPPELGPHAEAALRARSAALKARREAGAQLQQRLAAFAAGLESAAQALAGYKGALDEAEGALRARKNAETARRAEALAAAHPTITGEVIRPEAGASPTLVGPVQAVELDLQKRPAAPPPAPEGYEPTGMHKAPVAPPAQATSPALKTAPGRVAPPAKAPAPPAAAAGKAAAPERPSGRSQARVKMEAAVDLESESNFFTGFSRDISEGGLFVATVDLLPIGSEIDLRFTLPSGQAVDVQGVVRWRRELNDRQPEIFPGMGVQFRALPPQAAGMIQSFVGSREPLFFPD